MAFEALKCFQKFVFVCLLRSLTFRRRLKCKLMAEIQDAGDTKFAHALLKRDTKNKTEPIHRPVAYRAGTSD